MDLAKLLAILNDRALFFASGKTLSKFDRLEGQPTYVEIDHLNYDPSSSVSLDDKAAALGLSDPPETLADFIALERKHQPNLVTFIENSCFFNCWHMNDSESDAMWKIYSKNTGGVAIRSTVGRLKSAFLDPVRLIEKIVISPTEDEWFRILVQSIIQKMGYSFPVVASDATRVPPLKLLRPLPL